MWVFGYGSLAALPGTRAATLDGHRRSWGVAMDNTVELPGYKVYEDADGQRPAVCVAFLDVAPADGCSVTGAWLEVDDEALADLDARERSYERTALGDGRFVYRGREEPRARARRAREDGRLVVQREYYELVRAALGEVEEPDCPIVDLVLKPTPP